VLGWLLLRHAYRRGSRKFVRTAILTAFTFLFAAQTASALQEPVWRVGAIFALGVVFVDTANIQRAGTHVFFWHVDFNRSAYKEYLSRAATTSSSTSGRNENAQAIIKDIIITRDFRPEHVELDCATDRARVVGSDQWGEIVADTGGIDVATLVCKKRTAPKPPAPPR